VTAAAVVAGDPPLAAGTLTLGPAALRERYRSSMMGTHYTLEFPIEWTGDKPASAISVVCEFKDGLSGRTYGTAATLPVSRRPAATKPEGSEKR
jgi:phytoene dehydrogenase-like protein